MVEKYTPTHTHIHTRGFLYEEDVCVTDVLLLPNPLLFFLIVLGPAVMRAKALAKRKHISGLHNQVSGCMDANVDPPVLMWVPCRSTLQRRSTAPDSVTGSCH